MGDGKEPCETPQWIHLRAQWLYYLCRDRTAKKETFSKILEINGERSCEQSLENKDLCQILSQGFGIFMAVTNIFPKSLRVDYQDSLRKTRSSLQNPHKLPGRADRWLIDRRKKILLNIKKI